MIDRQDTTGNQVRATSTTDGDAANPPPIRPYDARMLSVGDGHWLYIEQCGRPDGRPCLFLHGGPGSGSQHVHRHLFDAERDHIILFDQRGAGRSHPYLGLTANTTAHLVEDIEAIRAHLGIDRWLVVGGSWGSTLALAYAERHPDRVAGLVLRAVFLGTRDEVQWAFVDGAKRFRPELYNDFIGHLPEDERQDPIAGYVARLTSGDPAQQYPFARAWSAYERALSVLAPKSGRLAPLPDDKTAPERLPPTPIVEAHYIQNDFFLSPGQLIRDAGRLADIPGTIVQGRYDLLCPPQAAYAVHRAWPRSRLVMLDHAGHDIHEAGVAEALKAAIAELP